VEVNSTEGDYGKRERLFAQGVWVRCFRHDDVCLLCGEGKIEGLWVGGALLPKGKKRTDGTPVFASLGRKTRRGKTSGPLSSLLRKEEKRRRKKSSAEAVGHDAVVFSAGADAFSEEGKGRSDGSVTTLTSLSKRRKKKGGEGGATITRGTKKGRGKGRRLSRREDSAIRIVSVLERRGVAKRGRAQSSPTKEKRVPAHLSGGTVLRRGAL